MDERAISLTCGAAAFASALALAVCWRLYLRPSPFALAAAISGIGCLTLGLMLICQIRRESHVAKCDAPA